MNEISSDFSILGLKKSSEFINEVLLQNPHHRKFLEVSLQGIDFNTRLELENYIGFCISIGISIKNIAACYNTLVMDTLREQMYFLQHKKYRHSRFEDVAKDVYFNHDYMNKYMHGQALSGFIWKNHRAMNQFFSTGIKQTCNGEYLEIGPGHGYYFAQAAKSQRFSKLTGIDISKSCIELTRSSLKHLGISEEIDNLILLEKDFMDYENQESNFSLLVMGEVLEHVEKPQNFLSRLRNLADSNTSIYVTTCINSPAIDHIYHFKNIDQVERMIHNSGLKIISKTHIPYIGKSIEECESESLSINVAFFLQRNDSVKSYE